MAGGANNDLVTVTGDLTLDGTLNVNARPGFGDGVYRLIDYGGALTDNGLALGALPTGDYEVQTSVEGQVNLVAGNTADLSIQFWDGTGAANDGAIAGGAGTWNAEAINWTDANGTPPRALMVGPNPVTPFTRSVIIDAGDRYATGEFSWLSSEVRFDPQFVAKNDADPRVLAARGSRYVAAFLIWSRFPYWTVTPMPDGRTGVSVGDMRFFGTFRGRFTVSTIVDD